MGSLLYAYFLIDLILNEILMEMESFVKLTSYAINYTREDMYESHPKTLCVHDTLLPSHASNLHT